jgi:hypothetical protein
LGCTGFLLPSSPPNISIALLLITSFTFMFVWVPDPVCHTTRGKWSFNLPSDTCRKKIKNEYYWNKKYSIFPFSYFNQPWLGKLHLQNYFLNIYCFHMLNDLLTVLQS